MSARFFLTAILLASAAGPMIPTAAHGAAPAIEALLAQARYWQGKGRGDLARQALNRVLAIDPNNAEARAASTSAPPKAAPAAPAVTQRAAPATPQVRKSAPSDSGGAARAAGFAALDRGDIAAAADRFQAALRARSDDADALGGLGLARLRARRFAEARDLLTRASARGDAGKWSEALETARFYADLGKAQAALKAGRLQEAENIARPLATSNYPDRANASLLLGDILSAQGRGGEAAALYAQAGASGAANGASLRAKTARAQAMQSAAAGDTLGAIDAFQAAISADPGNPWLRYDFAGFLFDQGRTSDAIAAMAPLASSSSADALYATALFAKRTGSPLNAAARMAQIPADQLTPDMKELLVSLKMDEAVQRIHALQAQGNIPAALAGARELAASPHAAAGALGELADLMLQLGDPSDATNAAGRAAQLPLADADQYQSVISVLARTGRDIDAAGLIQRLSEDGRAPAATAKLGAILAANQADRMRLAGQNAAAFDVLRAAWANAPSDRDILSALARLYQGGGMPGQAEQVYMMLLSQQSDDLPTLIGLAGSAAAAHDMDRARDAAARALALGPQNPDAYLAAASVEQARGNKSGALRYLKRARELSAPTSLAAGGAFPSSNPFAAQGALANPFAAAAASPPANPFALPSKPQAPAYVVDRASTRNATQLQPAAFTPFPGDRSLAMTSSSSESVSLPSSGTTDPTLARIDHEIAEISGDVGPAIEATTSFRNRSGESGLSKLDQLGATISASTHVGNVKVSASASPVVLDSGSLSRSALARFGTNPTAEAIGIQTQEPSALTTAQTQHDAGISPSVAIDAGSFKADVGTTPIGFQKTNIQGGVSWSPKLSDHLTVGVHGERRPVTDSLLSYAGAVDPVTGQSWGSVMRTGGGGSISYDEGGSGIYADGNYHQYDGVRVRSNHEMEGNIGGYLRVYHSDTTSVTTGANLNYQSYGNDQNYFSFGHGGYFSPQSFVSIAFPMHYKTDHGKWEVGVDLAPGFQSYQEDEAAVYPTMPGAQAQLVALKAQDNDVRATYDSLSKSGFAFAGSADGSYQVGRSTRLVGQVKYDTFGVYKEFQTSLSIRQQLGGGGQ